MDDNKTRSFFDDLLNAYGNSNCTKVEDERRQRVDIALRKKEYEKTLDEMWINYCKFPSTINQYNNQKAIIKDCGCKIFRNSKGQHKIVIP